MIYIITIEDDVYFELLELAEQLEETRTGYGSVLMLSFDEAVAILKQYPYSYRIRKGQWRIIPLKRFNYLLVYKIYNHSVRVFRLVHSKSGSRKKFGK